MVRDLGGVMILAVKRSVGSYIIRSCTMILDGLFNHDKCFGERYSRFGTANIGNRVESF